jgi:hypothetical protein
MKSLKQYIIEGGFFDENSYKEIEFDLTIKPNGPQLQKFLDKYGFKPVAENEELVDAAKYTQIYPAKTGTKISVLNWYKQLKDGSYLIAKLDGPGHKPQKYTGVAEFNIWNTGAKTKWILNKRYGADGYIKNSKEAEELLLNNKLDKKF